MKKSGFTLIELLVVIVIVGILFAVALPIFENATKKDTRRAAQQVLNTLRLARQHAISHRQWTLVVFPNTDSGYSEYAKDINNIDKCLRSYAVLAVTNNMDGINSWGPDGWGSGKDRDPTSDVMDFEFLTDWKMLPEGIYFDDKLSYGDYLFGGIDDSYSGRFTFPWNPADTKKSRAKMSAILFKPNGRIYSMADSKKSDKNKHPTYWRDSTSPTPCVSLTSAKHYSPTGSELGDSHELPGGTNTVIELHAKTGQVKILN